MRIVFVNQFFWPDAAATSQYLTDLTRYLAAQGHDVEVICGASSYAGADGSEKAPPVTCHRVVCSRYAKGVPGRMFSYFSFFASAFRTAMRIAPYDVIVTLTTPPMLPVLGTVLKGRQVRRHFIWEMDMFPEALAGVGWLKEDGLAVRLLGRVADWSRMKSDGIIALGDCMKERLANRGIPRAKVHVAENWADGQNIQALPPRPNGPLTVLYSGNLGRTHDVETILGVMQKLRDGSRFRFSFAGGGQGHQDLKCRSRQDNLSNVTFAGYCGRDELGRSLTAGQIGLVTQREECLGIVVPSKIYGLMAAGRPILYIGPRNSTAAQTIRKFNCGWQIDCGDSGSAIDLLEFLAEHREDAADAGKRARRAFDEHYDLPAGVARLGRIILQDPLSAGAPLC